ncbi:MAG TPA: hypothetical protein V6D30_03300 [Leptolyngbyaceae cyanobacterium]
MTLPWLDRLGEWNPQLFREIKGRLKRRNIAIAIATSVLGQLLVLLYWLRQIPTQHYYMGGPYCQLRKVYEASQRQSAQLGAQYSQLQAQFSRYTKPEHYNPEKIQELKGRIEDLKARREHLEQFLINGNCPPDAINMQLWWQDHYPQIFTSLSVTILFALLVVGSYMLINDLAREERRGTLNFVRLSPQSTQSILLGKLLGVPILLYIAAILTIPSFLWSGLSAQIPLVEIISFWVVLVASCAFFYSASLLFGLVSSGLGGFQSWLGSGAILIFLVIANTRQIDHSPTDWLNLFNPSVLLPYLVDRTGSRYKQFPFNHGAIQDWQWFYLPLGAAGISVVIFSLLNYGLWTYWIGQALNRRFRNPTTTMLSKQQSYLLVACSTVVTLGFALQSPQQRYSSQFLYNLNALFVVNLLLFLGLIAALSPHRQALQDWARYRRSKGSTARRFWSYSLVQDLIWGEKSPAVGAIAINLIIASLPVVSWILLWNVGLDHKLTALSGLVLILNLILLYAALTQLMLLMKTPKRTIWAAGTVVSAIFLPPLILSMLSLNPGQNGGGLWLFTAFPWYAVEKASATLICQVLFVHWSILGVLTLQLTRQLRRAGESASFALLAGRQTVSSDQ